MASRAKTNNVVRGVKGLLKISLQSHGYQMMNFQVRLTGVPRLKKLMTAVVLTSVARSAQALDRHSSASLINLSLLQLG
jgi:hypothetical protein